MAVFAAMKTDCSITWHSFTLLLRAMRSEKNHDLSTALADLINFFGYMKRASSLLNFAVAPALITRRVRVSRSSRMALATERFIWVPV